MWVAVRFCQVRSILHQSYMEMVVWYKAISSLEFYNNAPPEEMSKELKIGQTLLVQSENLVEHHD